MLALCLMLSVTHYAHNYAGIMGGSEGPAYMLIFYLLCYAAVLIKFTYYAQE